MTPRWKCLITMCALAAVTVSTTAETAVHHRSARAPRSRIYQRVACRNMATLDTAHAEAAEQVRAGNPRIAISDCFEPYTNQAIVATAPAASQEQFLFDYVDACAVAAQTKDAAVRTRYLRMTVDVGRRYVDWYTAHASAAPLPPSNRRVNNVVATVGDSYIELGKRQDALDWFELHAKDRPAYLASTLTIQDWDKALRYDEDTKEALTELAIKNRIAADGSYKDDWQVFAGVLDRISEISETRREAHRERAKVRSVLGE